MRSFVFPSLMLALLITVSDADPEDNGVILKKCCDVHQMLSADGKLCTGARNWPRNFSLKTNEYEEVLPPLDSEWVRRWLPPGLPLHNISKVSYYTIIGNDFASSVNASSWDPDRLQNESLREKNILFLGRFSIARPKPGGGFRLAEYCVDAAPAPVGPFAMQFRTFCNVEECAYKCCGSGQLLRNNKGHWKCESDGQGYWTPNKSSLTVFDPEFPHFSSWYCDHPRLLPFDEQYADWARHSRGIHQFHFSTWETCFDFYRSSNRSLKEGVFSCEHSRITRGVYWLLRPLCFLSALLLTVSLLAVICDKKMRRKTHSRCLASHAACLLAFNIGQIWYYISISDILDKEGKDSIPQDLHGLCKHIALSTYFVMTAAWFWLSALCVNMARGFRLNMPRLNKKSGKKFLVISALAWGLPAVLTITCSILFTQPKWRKTPAWSTPSLVETRMCYIEPLAFYGGKTSSLIPFIKGGTALFYYGPVCCLVIANIICLTVTLRKVQYLKRGNSVLRREEDQIPLGQRHTGENNPPTAHTATGNAQTPQGRNKRGTTVDAKTIKLYIKMILLSGVIELLTELIMWLTTHHNAQWPAIKFGPWSDYPRRDRDLAYRAAGYVTDFFRAVIVTWLAAPEGGYLGLIMKRLRRDKREKRSAGAGNAGRRKLNVA